jgi:putative phosphoribosyl transferase
MGTLAHCERICIHSGELALSGVLCVAQPCRGVILFATGHDPANSISNMPNDYLAGVLHAARLATLRVEGELPDGESLHDTEISRLVHQLTAACEWLHHYDVTANLPLGLYCCGESAAAAFHVAAERDNDIAAVVVRGGNSRMVEPHALSQVRAPTLLIAGGLDQGALDLNRSAYLRLQCKKRLEIIPGATSNFDEPGSPEVVARLVRKWFLQK